MSSEKVVVSTEDIALVVPEINTPGEPPVLKKLPPPIPPWAKVLLWLLVPVLPLLCAVAIVLRVAFRTQPPNARYALVSLLSTQLIVSGMLTVIAAVVMIFMSPVPAAMVNAGLPEMDQRTEFPKLATGAVLTSQQISSALKPLVIVVSPATKLWHRQQETASNMFGAGMLLEANKDGYLFATANHVVNGESSAKPEHVMVAMEEGLWSSASVIGTAADDDMALVWVPRRSGSGQFVEPLATPIDGQEIFVIGHPEGLRYTLSSGMISGMHNDMLQISAAISPGNSGGPVYDAHGSLLGVVSAKFDRNHDANAENLGFAVNSKVLRDLSLWTFHGDGKQRLETYLKDQPAATPAAPEKQ